jgi:hypothetical protein
MGQFLSPTLKNPEEFPELLLNEERDSEDGDCPQALHDSLEPQKLEEKSTLLPSKKDAIARTRSCPIPLHETLAVFPEEVELWTRRESNDTEKYTRTLKT